MSKKTAPSVWGPQQMWLDTIAEKWRRSCFNLFQQPCIFWGHQQLAVSVPGPRAKSLVKRRQSSFFLSDFFDFALLIRHTEMTITIVSNPNAFRKKKPSKKFTRRSLKSTRRRPRGETGGAGTAEAASKGVGWKEEWESGWAMDDEGWDHVWTGVSMMGTGWKAKKILRWRRRS